ncbi:hypothetical protein HP532_15670 [Pseudomonas sp. CrR25]|nr:hypothetical protein [Pseudomonas sp. CrR25]
MSKKTYATQSPSPDAKTPLHLSSNANGQLRYGLIGVQAGATAPNFSRGKLEAVGK